MRAFREATFHQPIRTGPSPNYWNPNPTGDPLRDAAHCIVLISRRYNPAAPQMRPEHQRIPAEAYLRRIEYLLHRDHFHSLLDSLHRWGTGELNINQLRQAISSVFQGAHQYGLWEEFVDRFMPSTRHAQGSAPGLAGYRPSFR